jgi:hypothetical protein
VSVQTKPMELICIYSCGCIYVVCIWCSCLYPCFTRV